MFLIQCLGTYIHKPKCIIYIAISHLARFTVLLKWFYISWGYEDTPLNHYCNSKPLPLLLGYRQWVKGLRVQQITRLLTTAESGTEGPNWRTEVCGVTWAPACVGRGRGKSSLTQQATREGAPVQGSSRTQAAQCLRTEEEKKKKKMQPRKLIAKGESDTGGCKCL